MKYLQLQGSSRWFDFLYGSQPIVKVLLVFVVTALYAPVYAQFGIAPEIGFNDPNWSVKGDHENIVGVHAGVLIHYDISERFFLQTGAFYKTYGFNDKDYEWKVKVRSAQVPLCLNYKKCLNAEGGYAFYIGGGGYIDKIVGGTSKESGIVTDLKIGNRPMDAAGKGDNIKEYDYGIILQMGGIHPSGVFDRVWINGSVVDAAVYSQTKQGSLNYTIGATAGFIFGYHRRHNRDDYGGYNPKQRSRRRRNIR